MQSGLALSERDCGLRVCDLADSRDRHLLKVQCLRTRQFRGAPHDAPVLPALEPVNKFCWQPAERQQDNGRSEWRNDEFDADAVPFQPRFLLQELLFAHCPHRLRSPIRGNFLYKGDWLSLRGIESVGKRISVLYTNRVRAIIARSVLAQESAENTSLMPGPPKALGNGPSRASLAGASIAYPGRPLVTKHERKGTRSWRQRKNCRIGKSHRQPAGQGQIQATTTRTSSCHPSRAALKSSADCPS